MTFWQRVQRALIENHISEAELSRKIGFTQAGISGWKTRGTIPRADIALKTANALHTTVEYLINGDTDFSKLEPESNSFLVPVLNQELSAGNGELLPDDDTPQGFISLPRWIRQEFGKNIAALHVKGDSMEPTLHDGDIIVCDSLGWDSGEGIYAVRLNGNGYIKRIQVGNGKIFIMSDNPKYKTIEEPLASNNVEIIGKARLIVQPL